MEKKQRLEDYLHLVEMENKIKAISFGTVLYWEQRCINREKMDDETYSEFERNNYYRFWKILVNNQK